LQRLTIAIQSMSDQQERPITLYEQLDAAFHECDPRASDAAALAAEIIRSRAPDLVVEHIGSTAIAGCAGKGIVDLMILYPAGQLERAKALLDELGFQRQTTRDPFPEERPMRTGALKLGDKTFRLHAHVIAADSEEAGSLRRFRDLMRSNAEMRAAYMARKRAIIESGVTDSLDYTNAKSDFIKNILDKNILDSPSE
jgi:GrpB-like predicted nucleotidyltransferase (UPF0157 family)